MSLNSLFLFVYLFIGVALLEVVAQRFWPQYYYRYGIPVRQWRRATTFSRPFKKHIKAVQDTLRSRDSTPKIAFVLLDKTACAYRPSIEGRPKQSRFEPRPGAPAFTHGFMHIDPDSGHLVAVAYLNWVVLPFFFLWFGFAWLYPDPANQTLRLLLFALGILAVGFIVWHEWRWHQMVWQVSEQLL